MNKTGLTVMITSIVVSLYVMISTVTSNFPIVFLLMLLSQSLLVWMVIVILKDKRSSKRTFDEYYYEDEDIKPKKHPAKIGN